jgi:HD-like signal output (HDOD) protein
MLATSFPRESLMHAVKTLPAAPLIFARLGRMLLDANADLGDVTALLRCDAALTARIIRIANSAAYNVGSPYASLEQALARVGFGEVYRLTGLATAAQLANETLPLYGLAGAQVRENSLLTALILEELAPTAGLDQRAAYTAGLLRSTGKIALNRLTRDPAYRGSYPVSGGPRLADWETDFAGVNNCDAAAFILNEWRFPPAILNAIRDHYSPPVCGAALAQLLNLAAGAADRAGHGLSGEASYWELIEAKLAASKLTSAQLDEAMRAALEKFGPLRAALA